MPASHATKILNLTSGGNFSKVLATGSTDLTLGVPTQFVLNAQGDVEVPGQDVGENWKRFNGALGLEFEFFGTGAAAAAGTYSVWLGYLHGNKIAENQVVVPIILGTGAFVAGAQTGISPTEGPGYITTTDRWADTLTFTPSAFGAAIANAAGAHTTFSPADDSAPARLILPDLMGPFCWHMEFTKGTFTNVNALFRTIT